MPEEQPDANDDFELQAEKVFEDLGEEKTPPESSPETKPEDSQEDTEKPAGAEPEKTEQVKEVEADETLSVEDKIAKVAEILGDDQKAIDVYVKDKGYHKDPAWIKQRERIDTLEKEAEAKSQVSDEDSSALAEFKTFRSTPEYIQMTMKSQGFTQETIDKKLQESGHEIETKPEDDLQFVLDQTGTKRENLTEDQLALITDQIRIANLLVDQKLGKILPKELAPVKEHLSTIDQEKGARAMSDSMEQTVKDEGILDYKKDVEPALHKFMDDNPDAMQEHVLAHFKEIYHPKVVERLKLGNNKQERDEKKTNLRQNISTVRTNSGNVPEKTGDFDKDADAILDAMNVQ